MCGILGIYGPSAERLTPGLPEALSLIAHRGPDGEGTFQSENKICALGHRRLSILDLSVDANQPMQRRHATLSYNGEIYNHRSLRADLDFIFNTHSDTETLLAGLLAEDVNFLKKCTGMFAGALYNEKTESLLLFRDPLGIKPLYYSFLTDSTVVFSSEIKALFALAPELQRRCDHRTLEFYLRFENYPSDRSLFEGVSLLPPGAFLRLTRSGDRVHREEGQIAVETVSTSANLSEDIRTSIKESVDGHLLSDVPLGVYLSGGIDSSLVTTLASHRLKNLAGFTGYFETEDSYYDERSVARVLARSIDLPLHEVKIEPRHFRESLDSIVYALDEPRMGMGAFSQYVVAKETAKHRKVVLAGHGGDELFGGYPLFIAAWLMDHKFSKDALVRMSRLRMKEWPWVANFITGFLRTRKLQFAPTIFTQAFSRNVSGFSDFEFDPCSSGLELLRSYYRNTYLPGLLLVEDKISMAHGLETRVPLWSQPLVGKFSALAFEQLIPKGELKGAYKNAIAEFLPKEVLNAPKRGFPTPLRLWFRGELLDFVKERLLSQPSPIHELVSKKDIETLILRHRKFPLPFALDERRAHRIWMLLCLESWFRQYRVGWGRA